MFKLCWFGLILALLGMLSNYAVCKVNNGTMPVSEDFILVNDLDGTTWRPEIPSMNKMLRDIGSEYSILDKSTRLPFLSDIIHINKNFCSVGDLLFVVGFVMFLYWLAIIGLEKTLCHR